jgi:hypothetical protein
MKTAGRANGLAAGLLFIVFRPEFHHFVTVASYNSCQIK